MDNFTTWPEAYPIPNQEAITLAEALVQNMSFGVSFMIHYDQGRTEVFQEVCQLLGIK